MKQQGLFYEMLVAGLSLLNFKTYWDQISGTFEMGEGYWSSVELLLHLVVPAPGIYMSGKLLLDLGKKYSAIYESESPVELQKTRVLDIISYYFMCYILVFAAIFLYIFIQKYGHPSFYTITMWYIYYFGVMNVYAPMGLSAVYLYGVSALN